MLETAFRSLLHHSKPLQRRPGCTRGNQRAWDPEMTKKPKPLTPKTCKKLADRVADRVLEARREERRQFRRHLGYLLMLIGAVSGLLTLLVMLWEWWF